VAKSSIEIFNLFRQKCIVFERIRKKQEALYLSGQIVRRDIEEVYAAIFLNAVASLEAFSEDLFIGLLARQVISRHSNVNVRVKIQSYKVAREVFLRGKKFFKWLPYENTENAAKTFFTGGRPFTSITQDEGKHLDKCLTIRNAIAHKSRHAIKRFSKEVLVNLTLMPREKQPKSYLRSQFSMAPPSTYYQQLVGEIRRIANKLC